jgi:5-methyltetrahydrofolate--homocysteine methyltransferase
LRRWVEHNLITEQEAIVMPDILDRLYDSIIDGEIDQTPLHVKAALDVGIQPADMLQDSMIPAMREVGALFECGDYFVPEMIVSARAMHAGLEILKPRLAETGVEPIGKVVIGTVQGDIHDIGKNLVSMMMEGVGFEVIDIGVDAKPAAFIEAVAEHNPDIVAMSALLTTTMPKLKVTIEALGEAGALASTKVLVGGAPVNAEYAEMIKADGFAPDAGQAAEMARSYVV